ncbi:hypothetical protein WA026_010206 [Henosepilachna vigintioctopunctata]|uniref:Uncharacterized protein n=1 Tax=Henosepilachna vigintioctopunctata TaxID=420089 RepID=A0AAW1UJT4_9CUCU
MNGAEESNSNVIPENITPETAPFLDKRNFRKIPKFRQTKIKLTKPLDWLPKSVGPRKIKWPNVSTKENSLKNNFPSENSIQESLTSRTFKGGEVIDKETSLQYFENGHFNVRKRTLNFSNSNSDMVSEIERNVLTMLGKNGNEPTILLFKIIPNKGMVVSDLRSLTEPLLSSLISDLPTSEINIITKAYYNKNQEIKLMKMKISINYSNDETTKNDNQLEENIYLVKYLKIIIHEILEHIEMNSSDQQISQFNFTIDCPSEMSESFDSNLIQSSEAILSQILPYENVDITSGNTQNDSNISSCSMNVIITPISNTNRIVWAPLIHLDGLSPEHLKYKIEHFVLEYLLNSSTSDQNISAVINFAFETNKVTSFDIIELENSISDILDEMQIAGKFLPTDARLELNNKKGIIIKMPFSISTTKRDLLRYLKNSYKSKIANTKKVEPSGRISDLILED